MSWLKCDQWIYKYSVRKQNAYLVHVAGLFIYEPVHEISNSPNDAQYVA